ncbi:hypothetical protein [Pinibacter aurantiacus]|uniref:PH domain-containing protein n=1 Tax=Pinibacter aurantiacus TaxID=2851599 RepID=A0A9E2S897_9BACT|nr:hypothetical protein [Pinibacter aurantiacus]MBV4358373.1 hypothetical protein [Pinibacter aurantiacus]
MTKTTLISKVQYKNFETGEFVDVQERSYEETIELIEKFPWNDQREKIVVDLTNPSITIEGKNNDFLKFALFFNRKYVLHYFDETQTLYTKSFFNLNEGFQYIKNYFEQPTFDTTDFRKENTWLQHNLQHFTTHDFRYEVSPKSTRTFLLSTSGTSFLVGIIFLIIILLNHLYSTNIAELFVLLLVMFLIGGGMNLILFFNYYNYAKDKVLIMSKGNDTFYFGTAENLIEYNKKEILQYTIFRTRGSRSSINAFAVVDIALKNGTLLRIPNLLVGYQAMEQKLFEYKRIEKNRFPFV